MIKTQEKRTVASRWSQIQTAAADTDLHMHTSLILPDVEISHLPGISIGAGNQWCTAVTWSLLEKSPSYSIGKDTEMQSERKIQARGSGRDGTFTGNGGEKFPWTHGPLFCIWQVTTGLYGGSLKRLSSYPLTLKPTRITTHRDRVWPCILWWLGIS